MSNFFLKQKKKKKQIKGAWQTYVTSCVTQNYVNLSQGKEEKNKPPKKEK